MASEERIYDLEATSGGVKGFIVGEEIVDVEPLDEARHSRDIVAYVLQRVRRQKA